MVLSGEEEDEKKGSLSAAAAAVGEGGGEEEGGTRRKVWRYGLGRISGSWAWRARTTKGGGREAGSGAWRVRVKVAVGMVGDVCMDPPYICRVFC